jgi:ATP-dependent Clp protease adaptor protein ClpS
MEKKTKPTFSKNLPDWFTSEETDTQLLEDEGTWSSIVLYNDDVNTFDWVIECLIDLCDHTPEQAEQCAILVHYKGKCTVLKGTFEKLSAICNDLCRRGLSAVIEEVQNA